MPIPQLNTRSIWSATPPALEPVEQRWPARSCDRVGRWATPNARQFSRPAAGDMSQSFDIDLCKQCQYRSDMGRGAGSHRSAEAQKTGGQIVTRPICDVRGRGCWRAPLEARPSHVTWPNPAAVDDAILLDHADCESGKVVLTRRISRIRLSRPRSVHSRRSHNHARCRRPPRSLLQRPASRRRSNRGRKAAPRLGREYR